MVAGPSAASARATLLVRSDPFDAEDSSTRGGCTQSGLGSVQQLSVAWRNDFGNCACHRRRFADERYLCQPSDYATPDSPDGHTDCAITRKLRVASCKKDHQRRWG